MTRRTRYAVCAVAMIGTASLVSCDSVDVAETQKVIDTARDTAILSREDAQKIIDDPDASPHDVKVATAARDLSQKLLDDVDKAQRALDAAVGPDGTISWEGAATGLGVAYPPAAPFIALGVPLIGAIIAAVRKHNQAKASADEAKAIATDAKSIVNAIDALRNVSPEAKNAMAKNKAIIETNLTDGAYDLIKSNSTT